MTGAALVIDPSLVSRLLFGDGLTEPGLSVGRVAGLALLSLAIGCWPQERSTSALLGVLLLSLLVAAYLIYLGLTAMVVGVLLWPAAATHVILAFLLARDWGASLRGAQ